MTASVRVAVATVSAVVIVVGQRGFAVVVAAERGGVIGKTTSE